MNPMHEEMARNAMKHTKRLSWLSGITLVMLALFINACSTTASNANATSTAQGTTATTGQQQQTSATSTTSNTTSHVTVLPTLPFTQIRMTDATHGWALDNDNVLKTSDGGKTWVALTPNGAVISPGTHADFMNALYAWFTMPNGNANTMTLFYTTTGGATWNSSIIHEAAPDGGWLTFVSNKTGWLEVAPSGSGAGSEGVNILRTDNGGATWEKISSSGQGQNSLPTGGIKSGLSFVNTATGWATGEDASNTPWLYMTHDGGTTWYKESISGLNSNANTGYQTLPPVFISNDGFLPLLATGQSPHTILAHSTNDGATWTVSGQESAAFQSSNLYVVNTQTAWATDQNSGDVYQTTNSGATWQKVASNTGIYGPLSFINSTTGFGLGQADQTVLKRTNDGGKTWQTIAYQIRQEPCPLNGTGL
ncbi:hypothetical protein ccbrp13_05880 [Ktedonobacteria bacterium brp13]|nr:hypothetical protein ccbrp13_05880 [Ktedonobacteria bacterium brp13]